MEAVWMGQRQSASLTAVGVTLAAADGDEETLFSQKKKKKLGKKTQ